MNPPRRLLVVVTNRLGDVLLATPLVRSLRRAWPDAVLDALVFEDTRGILEGNPDISRVIGVPRDPSALEHLRLLAALRGRYDVALSSGTGDRPTLYACVAGRWRAGHAAAGAKHWLKRAWLSAWTPFDDRSVHAVAMNLRLAGLAGVAPCWDVVPPSAGGDPRDLTRLAGFDVAGEPFVVLHSEPRFPYKAWTTAGWTALAGWLAGRGLRVVLSGGSAPADVAAVTSLALGMPAGTISVAGRATLAQTADLLARASLYVGPDTVTTHLAAAAGAPTVALFGPSNPVRWGPWPQGARGEPGPYALRGSRRAGNVYLVQGGGDCVPCLLEGCDRHVGSLSRCLQELPAATVIRACEAMLAEPSGEAGRHVHQPPTQAAGFSTT